LKTLENSFVQEQTENWDEKAEALKTRRGPIDPSKQLLMQSMRGMDLANFSRLSETIERESMMAEAESQIISTEPVLEECDLKEKDNPQYVSEYASEIFDYLRETEVYLLSNSTKRLGSIPS
jgi:hypothetical protein